MDSSCNPQKTITAGDHENDKPKGEKNKKSIFVIGDSMVKHLNRWEMSKKLNGNCNVFVKTFSVAKTACMHNYVKPSVRSSSDDLILHIGTNDLLSNKSPEEIARSITDLATSIQNEKHDGSISNITVRADDKKARRKEVWSKLLSGEIVQGEELLPCWPFHENKKKPFKQRKVTFK